MKKEPLSIIIVKTLLAIIVFVGLTTIIISMIWLVRKYEKVNLPVFMGPGVFVDGSFKKIPDLKLPVNETGAITIIKGFCEPENQDNFYGYNTIEKTNNEWRVQIINMNGLCYAAVNVKSGKTNCTICYSTGLFPPFEIVTITTDKTEYEQGETVEITVENNLDKPTWYIKDLCPSSCCNLHKWEDNEWKNLGNPMPCMSPPSTCPGGPCSGSNEIKPDLLKQKEIVSKQWNMITRNGIADVGKYKFSFYYGLSEDNYTEEIAYSNEFTIKEKSTLDPRCYEKVIIVGDCDAEMQGYEFNLDTKKCIAVNNSGCSVETPFKTLEECQNVCEKEESIEIIGSIGMIGNEPFTQLTIKSLDGEVYGITGEKYDEFKKLQTKKVKIKGNLLGRTPPSYRTEKSIEVISFEIIE